MWYVVFLLLTVQVPSCIGAWSAPQAHVLCSQAISTSRLEAVHDVSSSSANENPIVNLASRRDVFKFSSIFLASPAACAAAATASAGEKVLRDTGVVDPETVGERLHLVSTFTIVDKEGVPYMVVGEDAKATGYFFTTYGEAKRILKVASGSAVSSSNPWANARISAVPLDFAVTLVTKSESSGTSGFRALFKIAPAESDISDALALDKSGKDELAEGKVPLFYFEDFQTLSSNGQKQSPLYFRKAQLLQDWNKLNPSEKPPSMLVTELFSVVTEMVRPGGTDQDLKTVVFIPPNLNAQQAKECLKAGGGAPAFTIGKTNIVF